MCDVCNKTDEIIDKLEKEIDFKELAQAIISAAQVHDEKEINEVMEDKQFVYMTFLASIASKWAIRLDIPVHVFLFEMAKVSHHHYARLHAKETANHLLEHMPTPERKM